MRLEIQTVGEREKKEREGVPLRENARKVKGECKREM